MITICNKSVTFLKLFSSGVFRTSVLLLITTIEVFSQVTGSVQSDNRLKTHLDTVVCNAVLPFFEIKSRVGLSSAIYIKGHTSFYNYGSDQKSLKRLPTQNTIYEIGSITKTFCGVLLAQAVLDKKVKIEDDIRLYLDERYPNLEYRGFPIKLYQLLNHSSGLPFDFIDRKKYDAMEGDSLINILAAVENNYSKSQFFIDLHAVKIDTIPGIKLNYSNVAAQLLSFILEKVYQKAYPDLIATFITEPAKMKNTTFVLSHNQNKNLATGYNKNGMITPHFKSGAAGGLYSTAADMLAYGRMHVNEKNAVTKLSHEPTWGQTQYYAMGLNWQMQLNAKRVRRIWQSGSSAGFTSLLVVYPELDIVLTFLTNEHDDNSEGALSLIENQIITTLTRE